MSQQFGDGFNLHMVNAIIADTSITNERAGIVGFNAHFVLFAATLSEGKHQPCNAGNAYCNFWCLFIWAPYWCFSSVE